MNLKLSLKRHKPMSRIFKKILKTEQTPKNNNMISNNLRIKNFSKIRLEQYISAKQKNEKNLPPKETYKSIKQQKTKGKFCRQIKKVWTKIQDVVILLILIIVKNAILF